MSEDNIKTSKRVRRPAGFTFDRAHLGTNNNYSKVYYSVFLAGSTQKPARIYSRDLPQVPRTYKELGHHQYGPGFKQAALKEWQTLCDQDTFQECPVADILHFIIPLMWVFTYKLDEDGYLLKFKAQLVVQGDLQVS